ncbi:hypothetical protein COE55_20850, partial [Priestia megaterium]
GEEVAGDAERVARLDPPGREDTHQVLHRGRDVDEVAREVTCIGVTHPAEEVGRDVRCAHEASVSGAFSLV